MRSIPKTVATAFFAIAMACAPILAQTITIDYDHTLNFLKFRTYTWTGVHATDPTSRPASRSPSTAACRADT